MLDFAVIWTCPGSGKNEILTIDQLSISCNHTYWLNKEIDTRYYHHHCWASTVALDDCLGWKPGRMLILLVLRVTLMDSQIRFVMPEWLYRASMISMGYSLDSRSKSLREWQFANPSTIKLIGSISQKTVYFQILSAVIRCYPWQKRGVKSFLFSHR